MTSKAASSRTQRRRCEKSERGAERIQRGKAREQTVQMQRAQVQDLNNRLKRCKMNYLKTLEEQVTHRKMVLFQEESRNSAFC